MSSTKHHKPVLVLPYSTHNYHTAVTTLPSITNTTRVFTGWFLLLWPLYAWENKWEYLYYLQISTNYIPILNSLHPGSHFIGTISCHLKLLVCYGVHPHLKNGFKLVYAINTREMLYHCGVSLSWQHIAGLLFCNYHGTQIKHSSRVCHRLLLKFMVSGYKQASKHTHACAAVWPPPSQTPWKEAACW